MDDFWETLDWCGLGKLGFKGPLFTWSNKRGGRDLVQARLDRGVCCYDWYQMFQNSFVQHVDFRRSDHRPILVEILDSFVRMAVVKRRAIQCFHFEECWVGREGCDRLVERCWNHSYASMELSRVVEAIQNCKDHLMKWNWKHHNGLRKDLDKCREDLHMVSENIQTGYWAEIHVLERRLDKLLAEEESYWKQHSRLEWLKGGDRNMKFYHWKASSRRARNEIVGLYDGGGNWAVFDMSPSKAPSPDGLPAMFYHKFWSIVRPKVVAACFAYLNDGGSLQNVNDTMIYLIQKKADVQRVTDFRPISLCNVIYKIVAKALANRFRCVIGEVVSDSLSAFVLGRLITDNVIIGHEYDSLLFTGASAKDCLGVSSLVGDRLSRLIGVQRVRYLDRYLDIPDFASKNKKQLYKDIKERVWNRIRGCKVNKKTIHWAAWDKLCRGKDIGGMGFRNWINFNRALLAKQVWRLIKNPGSLTARVLKHLYFYSYSVLEAEYGRKVDAYAILSIPSSATRVEDTLCWHYTTDDNYSVKSGYKLGNESEYLNRASSSGSGLLESWWKTLWHLEIPTKVKVFIWRACRHWIPTRQCLAARHIPDTNGVCSDKVVSSGSANSPGSIISNGYTVAKWIPPLGELFKINTDAALDMENNIVGMGTVIRNRQGEVMGSVVQRSEAIYSHSLAEAVALLRGIEFAFDLGALPTVVECDAKGVVELINSGRKNYSEIGLVCLDITDRLRDGSISGIQFVARAAINVAHTLAKLALSVDHDRFWVESYPDCVSHCIQEDLLD
ncbi:hypothetical protein Ddye_007976 [Dipteronia dyeriana]|uniref:RNase H type-1 domain-containing protein n=1 Tax=Dipteronia dyeriana TaxID=168575 RepID=A0AAE0CKX9_9ROSI|nr:hypothetical protein Ddye_007976 [Dipteronia dyeriana]